MRPRFAVSGLLGSSSVAFGDDETRCLSSSAVRSLYAIFRFQMNFLSNEIHSRHRSRHNDCIQSGVPALGELSIVYFNNRTIARREQSDRRV
jgi:hypothetical protein